MSYDPEKHTGRLRRLSPEHYQGYAWVHWTMAIEGRKSGWLTEGMHRKLREAMLHGLARYRLICAAYCLMPDHGHFLLGGLSSSSDQRKAVPFLRKEWNRQLRLLGRGHELQKQPYDHVLTEEERQRKAFETVSHYILANAARAGLVGETEEYPYRGSLVVGYPDLAPCSDSEISWERFWKVYTLCREDSPAAKS